MGLPQPYMHELAAVDSHVESLREIGRKLIIENRSLKQVGVDLNNRLRDALDRVAELQTKVRELEQLNEELRELRK